MVNGMEWLAKQRRTASANIEQAIGKVVVLLLDAFDPLLHCHSDSGRHRLSGEPGERVNEFSGSLIFQI
jgi:hypothetical protein